MLDDQISYSKDTVNNRMSLFEQLGYKVPDRPIINFSNTYGGGKPTPTTPSPTPKGDKTYTEQTLKDYAAKHSIGIDQAKQFLNSQGYEYAAD
jgi:hypothetical protein